MDDASLALLAASARAWARNLIVSWREAWRVASQAIREEVARLPFPYEGPTRAVVRLRVDDDSAVTIFGVELSPTSDALDLHVEVVVARKSTTGAGRPEALIEGYWRSARTNWFPGRPPDPPLSPWAASMGPRGTGSYVVMPGGPSDLSVASLIAHYFRVADAPVDTPAVRAPQPALMHLYGMGQAREDTAIERWMYGHCEELLGALGLPFGWWCGLWLRRQEVFGEGADGDIDLLAGPLRFDFDDEELGRRVRAEAAGRPLATNPSVIRNAAIMNAAREGHVVWPPSIETVVACEVKASRFDGRAWRTTHIGEHARVKGQLDVHLDHGMDRVAFLHLCATLPRDGNSANPYVAAGADVRNALASLQLIFDPAERPECGFFVGMLGAVAHNIEAFDGASSGLIPIQPAITNPRADATAAWRERLRARLAAMPKPSTLRTYIVPCPRCGSWTHTSQATREWLPCPCTSP